MGRFVIADGENIYSTIFSDAEAKVIPYPYPGFRQGKNLHWLFYRFTHSRKLRYPFFNLWNRFVVHRYGVKKGDTVLLLSNAVWSSLWNGGIIDEFKRRECKVVLFMVDSMYFFENDRLERILEAARKVDLIYTFDAEDARQYGWKHTCNYYARKDGIQPVGEKSDVFCALRNGGRVKKLVDLYDALESAGVKCSFYIHGVSEEEQRRYRRRGIVFNHFIPYEEMLGRVAQTNVILELVKANQHGNTLREFEAVVYGKRLLTDYPLIESFPFHNENHIQRFSDIEDVKRIDPSFFTSEAPADYGYHDEFSPRKLFEEIERILP